MTGFVQRVMAAYASGTIDRKGAWQVTVAHDGDCPYQHGTGNCACVPEITATNLATGASVVIGLDGEPAHQQRNA